MNLATFLAIAASVWGGQPACGQPAVEWHATLTSQGASMAGLAHSDCRIQLSIYWWRRYSPAMQCDLVVHEYGHQRLRDFDNPHVHPGMEQGHRFRACRRWARLTRVP